MQEPISCADGTVTGAGMSTGIMRAGWLVAAMRLDRRGITILFLAIAGPCSDNLCAQARGPARSELIVTQQPPDAAEVAAERAAKRAELEEWLSRLVGKFRYDEGYIAEHIATFYSPQTGLVREYSRSSAKGVGHCVSVGDGPGVQCMVNVTWPPTRRYHPSQLSASGRPTSPAAAGNAQYLILNPAMSLFGIDPGNLGIRYLQVNGRGIAQGGLGTKSGDVVTFEAPCIFGNLGKVYCVTRIEAKPDRHVVRIDIDVAGGSITFRFLLRRLSEMESQAEPGPDFPQPH